MGPTFARKRRDSVVCFFFFSNTTTYFRFLQGREFPLWLPGAGCPFILYWFREPTASTRILNFSPFFPSFSFRSPPPSNYPPLFVPLGLGLLFISPLSLLAFLVFFFFGLESGKLFFPPRPLPAEVISKPPTT